MKRLLVTGLGGFVGQSLSRMLAEGGTDSGIELVVPAQRCDVGDAEALASLIADGRPTHVIHLAAQSHVPTSLADPRGTFEVNLFGTLNLLQVLDRSGFTGVLLFVGSSDVYGQVAVDDLPICETQALRPRNPYAVSKIAAEALCYQWSQTGRYRIVMVRPFNHFGPGQSDQFVLSSFARQIVEIEAGTRPGEIAVGDIEVTRDFTDVRDVLRAYLLLLDKGQNGEVYNVCSGVERSPRQLLERMLGLSGVAARIVRDEARMRLSEQRRACGSYEKLLRQTSWRPEIGIDKSLSDLLAFWRQRVGIRGVLDG